MKKIITGFLPEELNKELAEINQKAYRAKQILEWVYKRNVF